METILPLWLETKRLKKTMAPTEQTSFVGGLSIAQRHGNELKYDNNLK